MKVFYLNLCEMAAVVFAILIAPIGVSACPYDGRLYDGPAKPSRQLDRPDRSQRDNDGLEARPRYTTAAPLKSAHASDSER